MRVGLSICAVMVAAMVPMQAMACDVEGYEGECTCWCAEQDAEEIDAPLYTADEFMQLGVVESNGETWTWYSENALPGDGLDELNANGRHTDDDGWVRDADGYLAVASPWGRDEIGTVVDTPFGTAKVYDVCEGDSYDMYTSWGW